ncbi:MAG: hypothetical protein ACU0E9_07725 [Limimaricola soesokkakensis]|uniref:hypothetical protein n=1 Tax=Limimaricola soesokkakensis TaxID=1343159 RepID=UPI0040587FA8
MIGYARHLWAGLSRPSASGQTAEQALIRGLAHAVLGAACALVAPWWAVVGIYALAKERRDLAQGGDPIDGGFDVAFVAIGALGFPTWPLAAIVLGLGQGCYIWKGKA